MDSQKIRSWLALIIVGGFAAITFLVVTLVVIGRFQSNDGVEILKIFYSAYSGFVGLVIGYYFGRDGSHK